MTQVSTLSLRVVQLSVPLLAALVGVIAGVSPALGLALGFGVAYVILALSDLALGLALFVAISFLENLSFGGGLSLAKVGGGVLFLAWIGLATADRGPARTLLRDHPLGVAAILLLGAWVAVSPLWADDSGLAVGAISRWALNLALFPVVYKALSDRGQVQTVFAFFVLGATLSAAVGLAFGGAGIDATASDDARLAGTGLNANELGQLLVAACVLAGTLGCCRDLPGPVRMLAMFGSGFALLAMLMTVSRGAIVGLGAALLIAPFVVGPGRRVVAGLLVVGLVAAGTVYFVGFAPASAKDHVLHGDTSGSGRTDIWRVGLRMAEANPVLGVGADNYAASARDYLLVPGLIRRSDYILDEPKPAHNIYLQAVAELGVPGLVLLLTVIGFCLHGAWRAARRFAALGDHTSDLLARGLLVALIGLLASEFFSTAIYSKQLWTLLAMGLALDAIARSAQREA